MIYKAIDIWSSPPLMHYGIPGMKWGVRNDTDRAANRLARYGRKLDKARARYEMASQRTFKLSKKTDKLNRKANRLAKRSDKIASGKSDFGIWTDRQKKASSLAVKAYSTSEKKTSFEKQLYKSAAKANKYSKRVARYEKKVNKLMKQLNGVNAASLNISNKNKIYINDLLHNNMRHSDILDSDYLAHYGVKGMKWGVRKSVEQTGRVVRKMGGAVKNSASRIAGGLVRAGSAVRRFKNRRAIKSGNANRIQSRVDKMSTQELTDAVARAHLVSQLHNGGNSNSISLGDTVANSLKRKVGDMAANALQTTVTSALRGESPLSAMARNAKAEKVQQEQQISNNRLQTISNNYRIGNSALQNQADIAKLNIQIASSNDRIQSLAKSQAPISSIKQTYSMPYGRRYVRRKLNSSNTYRYALYQDDMGVDEFLAHYGVKGMKWGVRHQYEKQLRKNEKARVKEIDTMLREIRISNSKFSSKEKAKEALKNAKVHHNEAIRYSKKADKILKEVKKNGGLTDVRLAYKQSPSYNRDTMFFGYMFGIIPATGVRAYYGYKLGKPYANKMLNSNGDTPLSMTTVKYKIHSADKRNPRYYNKKTGANYQESANPFSMLNERYQRVARYNMYGDKFGL